MSIFYEHMPQLFEMLKSLFIGSPIAPMAWIILQMSSRFADDRCIQNPFRACVPLVNPLGQRRHGGSPEVIGNILYGKREPRMPGQGKMISLTQGMEQAADRGMLVGRIGNQGFRVAGQVDGAMNLCFNIIVRSGPPVPLDRYSMKEYESAAPA